MQLVSIERTEEYSTSIPQEPQQASIEVRGVTVSLKAESGPAGICDKKIKFKQFQNVL